MKRILTLLKILLLTIGLYSQENPHEEGYLQKGERKADTPFSLREETSLKGSLTFIANDILNRPPAHSNYNGSDNNHQFDLQYIDIDGFIDENNDGIDDTFSSSMSTLELPNCSRIVYAGLYWAGVYPYENWSDESNGINTRDNDFNHMKLKLPGGGNYVDITADDIIYDDGISTEKPYVCYKDVTSLVQTLGTNANGSYYGANIKATLGRDNVGTRLGSSAGWVIVIIYENETESSKKFFVFDGFSTIKKSTNSTLDVPFSGFTTIPVGPVRVNLLAAALEGDRGITGDRFQIQNTAGTFIDLTSGNRNPTNNFFNGSITKNNNYLSGRNPSNQNTLGFDVDMFRLTNTNNSIMTNGQTSGVMRFTTDGDTYWPFLNALSVEIIEPDIELIKTIEDASGNDIQGTPVGLGSQLFYNISFQNVGTDHATNTIITDVLPKNVDLLTTSTGGAVAPDGTRFDIDLPPDVTISDYEAPSVSNGQRARIEISVPDKMVSEDGDKYNIRIHAQVVSDCSQLRDVCSNEIQNQASASYEGVRAGIVVSDDLSYAGIDDCDFGIIGTSNFLVDTRGCSFETTQVMCGNEVTLTAGQGYESYEWRNSSGTLIATTTVPTLEVTSTGTYTVHKIASVASGCINADETIHVIGYNSEPNPLIPFSDQVLTCTNNGLELAEIYLCGENGSRRINLPFDPTSDTTVSWFQLDENSCADETQSGCPNVNTGCTWNEVGNGELSMNFREAGEYRLDVLYDGQCPRSYYFNVYKATLTPEIVTQDILCETPGAIIINNVPNGYEYSLTGPNGFNRPFQSSNEFTGLTAAGNYNLEIRISNSSAASCTYTFPPINIENRSIELEVFSPTMLCAGDTVEIRVQVGNVPGPYTYELLDGVGGVIATEGPTLDNDITFNVSEGGNYTVNVSTNECSASETIGIVEPEILTISALKRKDITCENGSSDGIIELIANGGTIGASPGNTYNFAVWTSQGTDLYASPSDIPNSAFLTPASNRYRFYVPNGSEGVYRFIVFDDNNCYTISQPIEIEVEPELAFNYTTTNASCNGVTDGTININVSGSNLGYGIEYNIDNTTWRNSGTFDNLSAGTYTVYIRAYKNAYQCFYQISDITITEPQGLTGGSATATDLECSAGGTTTQGTITFTAPNGGTTGSGYTYFYKLESESTYTLAATNPVTGLQAGVYNTRVTDTNGCALNLNDVTIGALPTEPNLTSSVAYNCDGTGNISITATPGPTAPDTYTYTLAGNSNTTGMFNNIAVGNHTVTVAYGRNCTKDISVVVQDNQEFTAAVINQTNPTCIGGADGTITVEAYFPSASPTTFDYNIGSGWNTSTSNPFTISSFPAGTHSIQVRPNSSSPVECVQTVSATLTNPSAVTATASISKEVTCNPATGATITASASGGNGAPYTYELFDDTNTSVSTTSPFTNIPAGTYTVVATDRLGCESAPFTITVNPSAAVNFTPTPVLCYNGSNGEIRVVVTSGNEDYQFSINNGTFQNPATATPNEFTFTGLTAATHDITVRDGKGCTNTQQATILPQVQATITPVSATCNDGQLQITPNGGDGNYQFYIEETSNAIPPITTTTSPVNVPAGTYTVYVRDKNGGTDYCEYSETVTVSQIANPTVSTSIEQPDCNGGTGTINVTVASGTAPYTVTVNGASGSTTSQTSNGLNYSFTGLAVDTYTISVTDTNNCSSTNATETIVAPSALTGGSATPTHVMCSPTGTVLGRITFTAPTGGTPEYIYFYRLQGATTYTQVAGNTVSNLPAGIYETKVEDSNGCERTLDTVTINDLPATPPFASSVTYNCDGSGNITITPFDATYTYSLDGGAAQTGANANIFNNVAVGSHTVTIDYGSNCTEDITVVVANNQEFTAAVINQTNPTCVGGTDGTITVEAYFPSSTPTTFDYNTGSGWNTSASNSFTITGFSAGTHSIQVRPDSLSPAVCIQTVSATLTDPSAVTVTATVTKEVTCNPATGATITPAGSGGNGAPFSYELFSGTTSQGTTTTTFTDIPAGTYTVVATDRLGCESDPVTIVVNPAASVAFDADALCYDGNNGTIEVTNVTGNGNYQFRINGGAWQLPDPTTPNEFTFTGLSAGNHTIRVQDERGCFAEDTVTINPQLLATATPTNASCNPTGQIQVNPIGGSGTGYEYSVVTNGAAAGSFSATNPITSLAADTYDVYVRDSEGCEYIVQDVVVGTTNPVDITATPYHPTCYGENGSIDVVIVSNTGQSPYTINISNSSGVINTINNFVGSSISFDNLIGNETYTITITDNLGCSDTENVTLTNPPAIVIDIDPFLPPNCSVDPTQTGFDFINISPSTYLPNTLQYSLDDGATWTDFTVTNGQIRGYNSGDIVYPALRTINSSGTVLCLETYGPYEISYHLEGLIVNPVANPSDCSTGLSVTVEAFGGNAPYEFAIGSPTNWQPADTTSPTTHQPDQTRTRTYTGLIPGLSYDFFVRDNTGCIKKNNEDVYDMFTPSVQISSTVNSNQCFGETNGQITFDIQNPNGDLIIPYDWTVYRRVSPATTDPITDPIIETSPAIGESNLSITTSVGLAAGDYYIVLSNRVGGPPVCQFGSLDVEVKEGTEILGQVTKVRDITCSVDGLVRIENVTGGFPGYTYTFNVTNGTGVVSGNTVTVAANTVTGSPVTVEAFAEDTNGCGPVSLGTVALNLSPSPNIVSVVPTSCAENKTIAITVNSGTAPYSYSIDGGTTFTSPTTNTSYTAEGLSPGNYNVVVRDANGCTATQNNITIHQSLDFDLQVTQNAVCTANGEVTLTITSGAGGDYSYTVNGGTPVNIGTTTSDVISLAPGTHSIELSDDTSGCSITKTVTVQDPVQPSFTYVKENSLCAGDNSGSITLTAVDNGTLPLTYSISPVAGTITGNVITDLPPNTYTVTGTGNNGCTFTITDIVISEFNAIVPATPDVDQFECTSGNTVNTASVSMPSGTTGGSGNYTRYVFEYTPADGSGVVTQDSSNTSFVITNTSGGPVTVTVYDDQGCSETVSTTIDAFIELTGLTVTQQRAIDCNDDEDIIASYSSSPTALTNFEFRLYDASNSLLETRTNTDGDFTTLLATGTYRIELENLDSNCVLTEYYTVGPTPSFDILITEPTDVICEGDTNGSAVLSFSASTPYTNGYSYVVYDATTGTPTTITGTGTGGTPTNITGLAAGEYYVQIDMGTNSPYCTAQSANFTINEPTAPLAVTGVINPLVSCNNGSNATITATATGGWGSYVYELRDTSTGAVISSYNFATNGNNRVFTNLSAGAYTVVVRDKDGAAGVYCEATRELTIANPDQVAFSLVENDNVCDLSTGGSITVNATGGTGTYTYEISGTLGYANTQILNANSYTFSNLPADEYTISVTDSNGCSGPDETRTINPKVDFSLSETKKIDCSSSPNGEITVNLVNWTSGTSNYEYEVVGSLNGTLISGNVTSNPFTVAIPSTNTTPQTYTVTVRDLSSLPSPVCEVSKTIEIQPETRPVITATATVDNICFGSSDGVITVSPTNNGILPLTYTISPDPNSASGVSSSTNVEFNNLPQGTYTITAEGSNECTSQVTVTIGQNTVIDISNAVTPTQFVCSEGNTANNAAITIDKSAITGGTGNYVRAEFLDPTGTVVQNGNNFTYIVTNQAGGTYTVRVYDDNNNCFATDTVDIDPFTPMTNATITVDKSIDCNSGENISVKVTPDITGVTYTITGDSTGVNTTVIPTNATDAAVFTNLQTDSYTIQITNPSTGCVLVVYHTVAPTPTFDVIANNVQNACFGGTGSVDISFSSLTTYSDTYDYEVFEVGGITTGITGNVAAGATTPITITGINPGNYYVQITMPNTPFCSPRTENFTIGVPTADLVLNGTPTFINCSVATSGEIFLTAEGGWGVYEYQLIDDANPTAPIQNFSSNRRITGLAAGSYTATVRDANGCEETYAFTLQPTSPLLADVAVVENDCEGEYTASIVVSNISGGQAQDPTVVYTYILTYPDGREVEQTANTFTNLPAGTGYEVLVRDNKYSCQFTRVVDIVDPTEVVISANITTDITCNTPQATVEVSAVGGTGTHEFSMDGTIYGTSNTFNLNAGTHTLYARDQNNCVDSVVVTVNDYEDLSATLNVVSGFVTCFGDANGVLSADVVGGFGNYQYQLLDGNDNPVDGTWQASNRFDSLNVGTYKINVRSTNRFGVECFASTASYTIEQPEELTVDENHTDVSCYGGDDGTITVLASGGNLTGYEYNISSDPPNKFVTDNVFRNLTVGTYIITVKDKVGCFDTVEVIIGQPEEFTATLTNVTEQTCINDATPTITIDVQGGTQPYYVSINNVELATPYTSNTITLGAAENIAAGTAYYITVRDQAGCNVVDPIRVTTSEPVDLQLTVDFEYTCPTGNILMAIVDEAYRSNMSYTLFDGAGNTVATNTSGEFIDVPAGTGYYVTATHTVTSCAESSSSTPIDIEDIQELTLTIDDSVKNTLIANASFGLPPYEYSVDGGDFGFDNEFLILQTKDYTITVRDARGCEVSLTVEGVYVTIFIPNLFSPDGDGIEDYWYPKEVEDYHDVKVFIYDRYAREIIRYKGIQQGWDGTYDGKPLPSGDYWYTIYYKELSGQERKLMGHFTLYR